MTAVSDSVDAALAPDEIRAAIDRIAISDVFSRSPQLGSFLRFVVEAVLHGRSDRIKAYTIGVEVLRRDARFDPQLDPIVRVEATRLRRAIERYYAGPGIDDPIIVDLPRGTYVPTFRRREIESPAQFALPGWQGRLSARPLAVGFIATIVMMAIVAGLLMRRSDATGTMAAAAVRDLVGWPLGWSLPPGNGMPVIHIEPLRVIGTPPAKDAAADSLCEKIGDAFARFDTVNVVYAPRRAANAVADEPNADYRLSGEIEYGDGPPRAQFRLVDVKDGKVVWSRSFERLATSREGAEGEIVRALTESLLQSYGVIRSRDRAKHLVSDAGDPRYRCILEAADSLRTLSPTEHERARGCLESLTVTDPSFAVGYAFLAMLYGREHQSGLPPRAGEGPALDRALTAVRRSIELNPASARAYVVLMLVLYNRRELPAAFAAGDKAIALNPYDPLTFAEYGGRLILIGETDKGMAMLRKAGESGAIRPAWQHFYMFMGAYLGGDLQEAAYQAGQITADNYVNTHLSRTLLAIAAGDMERATQAFDRVTALQPGWRRDSRAELARLSPSPEVVARLAGELAKLGYPGL